MKIHYENTENLNTNLSKEAWEQEAERKCSFPDWQALPMGITERRCLDYRESLSSSHHTLPAAQLASVCEAHML